MLWLWLLHLSPCSVHLILCAAIYPSYVLHPVLQLAKKFHVFSSTGVCCMISFCLSAILTVSLTFLRNAEVFYQKTGVKLVLKCSGHGNSCVSYFFCPAASSLPTGYLPLTLHVIRITRNRSLFATCVLPARKKIPEKLNLVERRPTPKYLSEESSLDSNMRWFSISKNNFFLSQQSGNYILDIFPEKYSR